MMTDPRHQPSSKGWAADQIDRQRERQVARNRKKAEKAASQSGPPPAPQQVPFPTEQESTLYTHQYPTVQVPQGQPAASSPASYPYPPPPDYSTQQVPLPGHAPPEQPPFMSRPTAPPSALPNGVPDGYQLKPTNWDRFFTGLGLVAILWGGVIVLALFLGLPVWITLSIGGALTVTALLMWQPTKDKWFRFGADPEAAAQKQQIAENKPKRRRKQIPQRQLNEAELADQRLNFQLKTPVYIPSIGTGVTLGLAVYFWLAFSLELVSWISVVASVVVGGLSYFYALGFFRARNEQRPNVWRSLIQYPQGTRVSRRVFKRVLYRQERIVITKPDGESVVYYDDEILDMRHDDEFFLWVWNGPFMVLGLLCTWCALRTTPQAFPGNITSDSRVWCGLAALFAALAFYRWLKWSSHVYYKTKYDVVEGTFPPAFFVLMARPYNPTPYNSIIDLDEPKQSLLGRLFDYGPITISVQASKPVEFKRVSEPARFMNELKHITTQIGINRGKTGLMTPEPFGGSPNRRSTVTPAGPATPHSGWQ